MHYRNGREAKNGDKIIKLDWDTGKIVAFGVLHSAVPGNDFCNGNIATIQAANEGACLCDCLNVDDIADILKEHGLDRRPKPAPALGVKAIQSAKEETGKCLDFTSKYSPSRDK